MIEALLYMFADDERRLREQVALAEKLALAEPSMADAPIASGARMDVTVSGRLKLRFNDTVFFECRPTFVKGPFEISSSNGRTIVGA